MCGARASSGHGPRPDPAASRSVARGSATPATPPPSDTVALASIPSFDPSPCVLRFDTRKSGDLHADHLGRLLAVRNPASQRPAGGRGQQYAVAEVPGG